MRLLCCLFIVIVMSIEPLCGQTVFNLQLLPGDLKPGGTLNLQFSITSSSSASEDINIELITWIKVKGREQLREVPFIRFTVRDNDSKDQEPTSGKVLLELYKIPATNYPLKYTAIVKTSNYARSVSQDVIRPDNAAQVLRQSTGLTTNSLGKFSLLLSGVILSLRSIEQLKDTGKNALMVYSQATDKTEYLTSLGSQEIYSPVMSPNNANIALLGCTDSLCHLYIYHNDTKKLAKLYTGTDLKSPYWLNNHELLFVNNRKLWHIDIAHKNIRSVFDSIKIERILTLYVDDQDTHHLVYQAQDPHVLGKNEVYLLEFNHSFGFVSNGMLPNNPNIYVANAVSKANGGVVISEEMPSNSKEIGIYFLDKQKKITRRVLSSNDSNYYDPSWSPDGKFITFVSGKRTR